MMEYIEAKYGFQSTYPYIADIKRFRLAIYDALMWLGRIETAGIRTAEKVEAIKDALQHLKLLNKYAVFFYEGGEIC